jgi:hypothetical protein
LLRINSFDVLLTAVQTSTTFASQAKQQILGSPALFVQQASDKHCLTCSFPSLPLPLLAGGLSGTHMYTGALLLAGTAAAGKLATPSSRLSRALRRSYTSTRSMLRMPTCWKRIRLSANTGLSECTPDDTCKDKAAEAQRQQLNEWHVVVG